MCWLKGHNHAWQDCPNNPISKNFAGKSYTEIPASKRYENNFAKKAEKLAKEEKEMKKKVAIKNDKKSLQFMTPMVKIQEEYQDLEYESDDEED